MIIRSVGIQIQLRNLKTIKASKMIKISSAIFKTFFLSLCIVANTHFAFAQTASILPPGYTQYLDSNGKPLSAGKVYNYIPSTTTPKTTWQDAAETIPNANPVILDAGGRAKILGDGSYRQIVKDRNNVTIWDAVTSSTGSGSTSPTATGDGDLVGTIKPWAGMTAPNQYAFAYGQEVSRTTYSALYTAITSSQSVFCNSGSPILNGLSDTTNFWIGMSVEVSCVAAGFSTIVSKTASTVVLADNANVTTNPTAIFYPWGRGNGTTTFNLPDLRGVVPAGNNNMGGVASANLTTTYFGSTDPNSIGALGGNQSKTLIAVNIPGHSHPVFLNDPGHTHVIFNPGSFGGNATGAAGLAGLNTGTGSTSTLSSTTGTTIRDTSGGFGTANQTNYTGGGIAVSATLGNTGSGYTNGAQTITITGGTCTTQPQFTVTVAGNIFTGTPALLTAGSCTVAPTNPAATSGGGGSGGTLNVVYTAQPISVVQPTRTTNYIIKITPDSNSATASGVTSLGGMTGDIACGTNVNCTGNIISFGGTGTAFLRDVNPSNFYVTTTGNDSNSCLVGFPCLTLQRAINVALGLYDFQGANATINVGAGSFAGATVGGHLPGAGGNNSLKIIGAGSGSTTITSTMRFVSYANAQIGSMRITVGSGSNILVQEHSNVRLADGDIDLGPAVDALVNVQNSSSFLGQSSYGFKISGGATYGFLVSTNSVVQLSVGATYTITGTPAFSTCFVDALNNSSFNQGIYSTWSGTATGQSYALALNSSIDMEQSPNPLPGTGYGTSDYSSYYYGVPGTTNESYFEGQGAGVAVTTGVRNTAIGRVALGSVSTSDNSTAMGSNALRLTTAQNDAFGSQAGRYISTSTQNVAIGAFTLGGAGGTALTGSGLNTAIGYAALQLAQGTMNTNTAVGGFSLASLTGADSNVALGYQAGFATISGFNTFVGTNAGEYVTSGDLNIAIGTNAFQASSGFPITGSNNIGVGVSVALAAPSNTNSIIIGSGITGLGSNSVNLGGILTATGINVPATSTVNLPGTLTMGTPLAASSGGTGVANSYTLTIVGSNFSVTPRVSGQWPIWSAGSLTGGTSTTITNAAAPASPAAGSVTLWTDSTDLRFHDKNSAGTIGTTVVADAGASHNFLTGISAAGVVSKAQPTTADILGTTTNDNAASGYLGEYASSLATKGTSTVTISNASPGIVTWAAHGLNIASPVNFTTTGGLPTGLSVSTNYYVCSTSFAAGSFAVATSVANALAGTCVNTSSAGSGTHTALSTAILTTGTPVDMTAISLTAGDWDVDVACNFTGTTSTTVVTLGCGISTTTATFDNTNGRSALTYVSSGAALLYNAIVVGFPPPTVRVGNRRISISATTTIIGIAGSQFGASTSGVYGTLTARRVR